MNSTGNLTDFLIKNLIKHDDKIKLPITNTRIGDKDLNIFGGSYHIPDNKYETFLNIYYQNVFEKNKSEYLTEKQIINNNEIDIEGTNNEIINGPLLVDFDFRYENTTTEKQYNKDHIFDIVSLYLEELKQFYIFDDLTEFSVYVMEKSKVNILNDIVKDGIHMIIGIQMNHILQQMLRLNIIDKIKDSIDIPIINDWENVIDTGITKGVINWQLYGSKKPNNEAYLLTGIYNITYDLSKDVISITEKKMKDFDLKKNIIKLSARNINNPKLKINPDILDKYQEMKKNLEKKPSSSNKKSTKYNGGGNVKLIIEDDEDDTEKEENEKIKIENIKDKKTLEKAVDLIFSKLNINEYYLKEIHQYTQILPEKYYCPGSHILNRQVGFALKHTDERLFLSWIMLRSKAIDFDYSTIQPLYKKWKNNFNKEDNNKNNILTKKSIIYWAKNEAFEEYEKIKKETIDYYIELTLNTPTEFDFACVLNQMYKEKYVCSSIVSNTWYVFNNHKWEIDRGNTLRLSISRDMHILYNNKINECIKQRLNCNDEEQLEIYKKRFIRLTEISSKLKKTSDKNNIMKEAMELFYDGLFMKKLDANKNLLAFNNGVIDFENKIFRNGEPLDYISKSTNIDYLPNYKTNNIETINEINNFMKQLFPIESLNEYMWEHLASCLIGVNRNQTFNIYKGVGSNGKSMLTDLMTQTLGDYKGVVPLTLITEKRTSIGGTSSEIMQLKGIRYAVMQEASKNMKINEGVMKEIVGGDPLQGRSLYSESETFDPQFTLAVCTNVDFTILSNDDGTWRRIRRVPFLSKFVDNIDNYDKKDENNKYIFLRDRSLKEKFPKWVSVFASMLVDKVYQTEGIVKDCDIVLEESNNYRKGQDIITAFIDEMIFITNCNDDYIIKKDLNHSFTEWFKQNSTHKNIPTCSELAEQMNKKIGKLTNNKWKGCKFNIIDDESVINNNFM